MILPYIFVTALYLPMTYLILQRGLDKEIPYSYVELPPTSLLTGFQKETWKPLIVNMLETPHILITGLSGQGKSRMTKAMLKNIRGANIIICNAYRKDYKDVQARFISGEQNIKIYLKNVLENHTVRENTLYIVLEEMMSLKDKELVNYIKELLCVARHYNIYIIGIIQIATKEECKFKSYFNARLSFKQLEDSSYRVALGCGIDKTLKKQEFALVTDGLYYGKTYNID